MRCRSRHPADAVRAPPWQRARVRGSHRRAGKQRLRPRPLGAHIGGRLVQLRLVERLNLATGCVKAAADAVAEFARHQRRRSHDVDGKQARAILPPNKQQVPKAMVGNEDGPRTVASMTAFVAVVIPWPT